MIISQTPLRTSFFGGGTDIKDYYRQFGGAVLSSTIDKYIYIIVKSRHDDYIILNYSEREKEKDIKEIKHGIFREALQMAGIEKGIEITSIADIPAEGSGLGSSSSFAVGLLNALFAFKGEYKNAFELAELACEIEINRLGEPIGKQDQYAAAIGGFNNIFIETNDKVNVSRIVLDNNTMNLLNSSAMLFYTGITRKAAIVLSDQKNNRYRNILALHRIKEMAVQGRDYILNLDIELLGQLLDRNWEEKKTLSGRIVNKEIDEIYSLAKQAGVYGGKLLGAGGGGYFLFFCPPEKQKEVRTALKAYQELPFCFEKYGSRIIFNIRD